MTRSARALFRARRPSGDDAPARRDHDFYPTVDPGPIAALVAAEVDALAARGPIWEPACGAGDMARQLRASGFDVVASDLVDRGAGAVVLDYLLARQPLAPVVVTNPPFVLAGASAGGRWVRHGWEDLSLDYMALFLPLEWASSATIARLLVGGLAPSRVYPLAWRVDFTGAGSQPSNHMWVVWDRRHLGPTQWRSLLRPPAEGAQARIEGL